MELPKIESDPFKLQKDLEDYFHVFLETHKINGYFFKKPVVISLDEENDQMVFVLGLFRNTNGVRDNVSSIYFIYYDGCSCSSLEQSPGNRYESSILYDNSLTHQWLVYKQLDSEFNSTQN